MDSITIVLAVLLVIFALTTGAFYWTTRECLDGWERALDGWRKAMTLPLYAEVASQVNVEEFDELLEWLEDMPQDLPILRKAFENHVAEEHHNMLD